MKVLKSILALVALLVISVFSAQAPSKMSYQAVIRNSSNGIVANQTVGMRISILQSSVSGTAVYVETNSSTTNSNGLVSTEIGGGTAITGSFSAIDWSNGSYFVKVETDPTGGTNYTITSTTQLLSVPYALYAKTAGSLSLLPPTATTQAATNLDVNTATINGLVNGNGFSSAVTFDWGLTTSYGSTSTPAQSPVTGSSDTPVNVNLTGLQGNTTYHYRVKASNAVNVTIGSDMQFTTLVKIPTVTTLALSNIKGNAATAGGSVTNNGGSAITAQGLCWSTSPNPTIANSLNTSFTADMTSLSPDTVYYVRAYATNVAGTGYGNQISFNSGKVIGSTFGGGLVFYNDGSGHGLVCASTDQSTGSGAEWGCFDTVISGTSTTIGTGNANTIAIVSACSTAGIAARICNDLVLNSYSDWYLPSRDELMFMYTNLWAQNLGGFSNNTYWSSSDNSGPYAYVVYFSGGYYSGGYKQNLFYVRAVRSF